MIMQEKASQNQLIELSEIDPKLAVQAILSAKKLIQPQRALSSKEALQTQNEIPVAIVPQASPMCIPSYNYNRVGLFQLKTFSIQKMGSFRNMIAKIQFRDD